MLKIASNVPCVNPSCCGCLHGYSKGEPIETLYIFVCNECGVEAGRGLEEYVKEAGIMPYVCDGCGKELKRIMSV